jgi:membrane protease YdiL (CAAX protease family)
MMGDHDAEEREIGPPSAEQLPALSPLTYRRIALRFLQLWGWIILYLIAFLTPLFFLGWLLSRAAGSSLSEVLGEGSYSNPVLLPVALATAAAAILATRHVRRRERYSWQEAGLGSSHAVSHLHLGTWIGVLSYAAVPIAATALGWASIEVAPLSARTLFTLVISLFGLLFAAAFEEIGDRGILLSLFARRRSRVLGVVLTSLLFAVMHLPNPGADGVAFLSILIAGVTLAVARYRTGAVWLPIGWHLGWNLTQGWVFGSAVSGTPTVSAPLLVTHFDGPGLLVGREFGPESGLIAIAANLMALGLFLKLYRPSPTGLAEC